ncbi:MAG: TyeA family type III secretion system gatekeeper subunit [Verrucomicrobiota bacterium]
MPDHAEISRNILRETLALSTSSFVQVSAVERVVNQLGTDDIEKKIYFLQAYLEYVRGIPEKIYPSLENRAKLLEAIQECLDGFIELEEAEYE